MSAELLGPDQLLALAEKVLGDARPGEAIEVAVSHSRSNSVRVHGGELESFTRADNQGIGVRLVVDGRQGFASAGTLDEGVVSDLLDSARSNAAFSQPDPHAGVAEPDGVEAVDIDLWRDEVVTLDEASRIRWALDLEARVLAGDPSITGVRVASYGDSAGTFALASTAGIRAASRATSASAGVQALASDGDRTRTGYGYDAARNPFDLDWDRAVRRAVERSVSLRGAAKPQSAKVDLVLDPDQTSTVMGLAAGTLTADRVLRGRSPFAERLGETVASPLLTLVDDPTDPASLAADSHDGEGLATRRNVLIEAGVLQGYLYDSYNARRAGVASTGSAVRGTRGLPSPGVQALAVAPGDGGTLDDLIAGVELGVLVYNMAGLHSGVNPVSGDLSVGVEGRLIRDGRLAEPISEATVASTLQRLLLDVKTVGSSADVLPNGVIAPPLVIGGAMLSGATA